MLSYDTFPLKRVSQWEARFSFGSLEDFELAKFQAVPTHHGSMVGNWRTQTRRHSLFLLLKAWCMMADNKPKRNRLVHFNFWASEEETALIRERMASLGAPAWVRIFARW